MGTCHVRPSPPGYPRSDLGVFILMFLFSPLSSHRGHHPGCRLSGSQPLLWLRSQRTEHWTYLPSPAKCSHTVTHMHTHRWRFLSAKAALRLRSASPRQGQAGDAPPGEEDEEGSGFGGKRELKASNHTPDSRLFLLSSPFFLQQNV